MLAACRKGAHLFRSLRMIPMRAVLRCLLLAFATGGFACGGNAASSQQSASPTPAASPKSPAMPFDGERAFAHVKAQVEFGPRPAGSAALEKTREYLMRELTTYGLKVSVDEFIPVTPRGRVKMKNVVAELPGSSSDIIIIASHYDTKVYKQFTFVGANDAGSSTGAVLEIARVMATQGPRRPTYQFVFFDGEEAFCEDWGECLDGKDNTYGSRHYVERLTSSKQLKQVKAMILLDMVGDKNLTIPREESSSGWLVDIIWSVAAELGHMKEFPSRRSSVGDDDHMPFIRAGVSAVDIIDFEYGEGPEDNRYWHTAQDTIDKVSARSLKIVGDVVLSSLPRIEGHIR